MCHKNNWYTQRGVTKTKCGGGGRGAAKIIGPIGVVSYNRGGGRGYDALIKKIMNRKGWGGG